MENKIKILPGIPDDDNREYLPEAIKGSDIVVNENGNNSQPYPKNLQEFHGIMGNDTEDEWYEYVPECYDPSRNCLLYTSGKASAPGQMKAEDLRTVLELLHNNL